MASTSKPLLRLTVLITGTKDPRAGYGMSKSRGGTLAISCFSRTAELNICRGETRVTSQFVAISGGIVGYPRANDTVALLEHPRARSNIPRKHPISTFFLLFPWWLLGLIISMSESWDRMCTLRVIYDGDVVTARCTCSSYLGEINNSNLYL